MNQLEGIVSLDLGDGESAVATCSVSGNGEPDVLTLIGNRQSFLTCISRERSGAVLIGEPALESSNVATVNLTFKQSPIRDPGGASLRLASDFFCEVMRRAEAAGCDLAQSRIIVGHPSAWSLDDVEQYTKALPSHNAWNVRGVSESRAAFLQIKETGKVTVSQLRSTTLIVDIGSSTTDFTLIKNLAEQPIEFGHNSLGGRLIDRAMLGRLVESHADAERVRSVLTSNSRVYANCELLCRRLKEKFFSDEAAWRSSGDTLRSPLAEVDDETVVRATVDASGMDNMLLQQHPELDGMGWKECFRSTMESVREQCTALNNLPKTIAMTGGGARMLFTQEICKSVFPDATIITDQSPEFCIVKGLARAGRWDARAEGFMRELEPICDALPQAFLEENGRFLNEVIPPLAESFIGKVLVRGLLNWRNGTVSTLQRLESHLESLGTEWAQSLEIKSIVEKSTVKWTQRAMHIVAPALNNLCHHYGLPPDCLDVKLDGLRPDGVKVGAEDATKDALEEVSLVAGGIAGLIGIKVALVITPIILAVLLKLTIITAAMSGPLGWVIGAIIVGVAAFMGKEAAAEWIKTYQVPNMARGFILTDNKVRSICTKAKMDIESAIREALEDASKNGLVDTAVEAVRDGLSKRMKDAIVLISR